MCHLVIYHIVFLSIVADNNYCGLNHASVRRLVVGSQFLVRLYTYSILGLQLCHLVRPSLLLILL